MISGLSANNRVRLGRLGALCLASLIATAAPALAQELPDLPGDPVAPAATPMPTAMPQVTPTPSPIGPVNVLFVVDSSHAMDRPARGHERSPKGHRLADYVARELPAAIEALGRVPGLSIGMRSFGRFFDRRQHNCLDSTRELAVEPLHKNRERWSRKLSGLRGRGQSPLGRSLAEAGKDFRGTPGRENVVILVTAGADTCDGDPCAEARSMQRRGRYMPPLIIALDPRSGDEERLRCTGRVTVVRDMAQLRETLSTTLRQVIAGSIFRIEVVRDGQFLNEQAHVVVHSTAEKEKDRVPVTPSQPAGRDIRLFPGRYDVRVSVDSPQVTAKRWMRIDTVEGRVERHILDLSDAKAQVRVLKNGAEIAGGAIVEVFPASEGDEGGGGTLDILSPTARQPIQTLEIPAVPSPAGVPLTILPGRYDLRAELRSGSGRGSEQWLRDVPLVAGEAQTLVIDMARGSLRCTVKAGGEEVGLDIAMELHAVTGKEAERRRRRIAKDQICDQPIELAPGRYDAHVIYLDPMGGQEYRRWVQDLRIAPGEVTDMNLDLDAAK